MQRQQSQPKATAPAKPQWDEVNCSQCCRCVSNSKWWLRLLHLGEYWYGPTFTLMIKDPSPYPSLSWTWTPAMYQAPAAHRHTPMRWYSLNRYNRNLTHLLDFKTSLFRTAGECAHKSNVKSQLRPQQYKTWRKTVKETHDSWVERNLKSH